MADLALDSDSAVVTSGGAEFHTWMLGYKKLCSLILDLKGDLSLFKPALRVMPWSAVAFSKRWPRQLLS